MKIKLLIIFLLCFFTSGCWNYNELNDFAIVTGLGIDKDSDNYKISLMISNAQSPQSSSKEGQAQTSVFTGIGKNINEALDEIETKNPRKIYLGHLEVVVINEEIAKEGLKVVIDALLRNPETTRKYYIAISKDNKAEDILKTLSPIESFPSQNISLNIKNISKNQGISNSSILGDFIKNLLSPGIDNILPCISIEGSPNDVDNQEDLMEVEPKAMLKIEPISLFKDFKLVNFATKEQSQGINIINNNAERVHLTNKINDKEYDVVLLDKIKTKIDLKIKDEISIELNIKASGAFVETNRKIDLDNPKTIEKINKKTEETLKDLIYEGINFSKENETDIFGIGNMIYKNNPKYWKKIKNNWNNLYFKNLNIKVNTIVNIKTKGSLGSTLMEAKNES